MMILQELLVNRKFSLARLGYAQDDEVECADEKAKSD